MSTIRSDKEGKKAGFHRGGYFRFGLDVTDYIQRGQKNELVVFVYDPTDSEGDVASQSFSQGPAELIYSRQTDK